MNPATLARIVALLAVALHLWPGACRATETTAATADSPAARTHDLPQRLAEALAELAQVRDEAAAHNLPLSQEISRHEEALLAARQEQEAARRALDAANLALNNLREHIKARTQEKRYLANLLGEYVRNLETQVHIVQSAQYAPVLKAAKLAHDDQSLSAPAMFAAQMDVVQASIGRLHNLNGGCRFQGEAVNDSGVVTTGQFVMVGPHAFFVSADGATVGMAVERLGSLKPNVVAFPAAARKGQQDLNPGIRAAATTAEGVLPLDSTMGKAQKVAETRETLLHHIGRGGIVMIPILGVALLAALVALLKWIQLARVTIPPSRLLDPVLVDLRHRRRTQAEEHIALMSGPIASMLDTAVKHLDEPKELIEELMYEHTLELRMRLHRGLPFLAVCASSAPLLGLLGTVTGIISTFKLITAFGSSDIKMLSAGISEALITTEYGLYVAIPSLLLHAFLNRRVKTLLDLMEKVAVGALNQLSVAAPSAPADASSGPRHDGQPAAEAMISRTAEVNG